ncbi:MAG TPA: hypothetical protein VHF65_01090 [Nitrososphaera sp.]|jgi:uncharacterized membrane protein YkoI|nr:hypothetical protein [Nitrososphaera sp.]
MRNTQFLVFGSIAIVLAGLFTTMSLQEIMAQQTNSTTTAQSNQTTRMGIPQINGSVNIEQRSNQLIRDSIQVPFATALETAQSEVGNGTAAISGSLGVVQGYLVYIIKVANFDADTSRTVIVDAGNGAVLYTSGDRPLHFGGVGGPGCGYGSGGEDKHHHKGFGNHGGNYDRGMTTDRGNSGGGSGGQSTGSGVVASPAIGV